MARLARGEAERVWRERVARWQAGGESAAAFAARPPDVPLRLKDYPYGGDVSLGSARVQAPRVAADGQAPKNRCAGQSLSSE